MGCRAVIVSNDTTKENANTKLGIYLHWYGDLKTVKELLKIAQVYGIRSIQSDPTYGWARLCQICADRITDDSKLSPYYKGIPEYQTGIGIGIVSTLDCHNYDNGVYYIDDKFNIVKQTSGEELED